VSDPDYFPLEYPGLEGLSWLSPRQLAALIDLLPEGGWMLEVGTAAGVTAAKIAESRPDALIVCVDTFADSDDPAVAESDPHRWVRWRKNARPNMHLWLGDLASFSQLRPSRTFDVALIDGDHAFDAVLNDLRLAWKHHLKFQGVIVAHDCGDPNHPGVTEAVDRFCEEAGFRVRTTVEALAILEQIWSDDDAAHSSVDGLCGLR
jgi:hypothetical protein